MAISREDRKQIARKVRRDTSIPIPTKVHRDKKKYTRKDKHKTERGTAKDI